MTSGCPQIEDVARAVETVVERHPHRLRAVVAHGSWVRGDFWVGQSDIDLFLVGEGSYEPPTIVSRALEELRHTLGVRVEPCGVSHRQLEDLAALRSRNGRCCSSRFVQLDLHGFDFLENHRTIWGTKDVFEGFPVAQGPELQGVARQRVRSLLQLESKSWPNEMNKWACEALKAAQIFYSLARGRPPTRDKRVVLERFYDVVPEFDRRGFADTVWSLYKQDKMPQDEQHRRLCLEFIQELDAVLARVTSPTVAGAS